jgi:hypothetical protein
MEIYFIGVLIAFVLCLYIHWIEVQEGCAKDLVSDIIVTAFVCMLSWGGMLLCLTAIGHYHLPNRG